MTNLYNAHRQWCSRPPDQRFPDLESLLEHTRRLMTNSREGIYNLSRIHLAVSDEHGILLNGSSEPALLTNWAFGQLSASVGAPAKYLRTLSPQTVIQCLAQGLGGRNSDAKMLTRENGSERMVSAFTGPNYGRIWDAAVVAALEKAVDGSGWHVPSAHLNGQTESAGLYASDRDMFAFFVNDETPIEVEGSRLSRGFFCWNSETGSSAFGLTTFLYDHVCGNHIVWGVEQVRELRIVHRTNAPENFYRRALPILNRFIESSVVSDAVRSTVASAAQSRIGDDLDQVMDWFKTRPFTRSEIRDAYKLGVGEGQDVSTIWGMVQGLTSTARYIPHTDRRVSLEKRAGALLVSGVG